MTKITEQTRPLTEPLEPGEYARSVKLGEKNALGVPGGEYLITSTPGDVGRRAKLTLGPKATTEIVARFPAEDGRRLSLVKVDSHHRKPGR